MSQDRKSHPTLHVQRRWYTLSVDSLRGWAIFFFLVALVAVSLVGYRQWEEYARRWEAADLIAEASGLATKVNAHEGMSRFRGEYETGLRYLQEARRAQAVENYRKAVTSGLLSRNVLRAILEPLERSVERGEASFIAVQGNVEFRRGETGEWQGARSRIPLRSGDYVRTSNDGSAEILFDDGTLYTVSANTSFIVSRQRASGDESRSIDMQYGWVNLNTASQPAVVTTPSASARVEEASEAYVSYQESTGQARFGAFRGRVEVATEGGDSQDLEELEQVQQVNDRLSSTQSLPGRSEPLAPQDNFQLDSDREREILLTWANVEGAARYALQVSRNSLFVDNVIDVDDRSRPRARLGIRGGGSFQWRVAAISRGGFLGPWSPPRRFRISSLSQDSLEKDEIPPLLELEKASAYGNIVLIGGRTEPGAVVEIDGEPIQAAADGSFFKTIQLANEGWSFIQVRARDVWGNETAKRQRVFVEPL
ncbi:MAG: FecR domain-containing protein [Acidobacteriota bacterium]